MALKIRLRQQGRNNRRVFRIVVADVRSPRDGKYVESVGWYNPYETEQEKLLNIKSERVEFWLKQGAEISPKAEALVARAAPTVIKAHKQKIVEKRAKLAKRTKKEKIQS